MNISDNKYNTSLNYEVSKLLQTGTLQSAREMLKFLAPEEVGHLIESSLARRILWALVDENNKADIIHFLNDEIQAQFALEMDSNQLVALSVELETDDLVDILQQLPDRVTLEVLQAMSIQDKQRVSSALSYPENTAGGLMNTDTITVRDNHSIDVVLRYLRRHDEIPK